MKSKIDYSGVYKLPWNAHDNPGGWIEVTTYCQLKCPGCYRGLAEKNPSMVHEDLNRIKEQIDKLIAKRNIQTLSIAGGEPLMYPKIKEVVSYAASKRLKTKIFTNGCLLDRKTLEEMKKLRVTEFIVHIDTFQKNRPDMVGFSNINELRQNICNLFRSVGGVNLGFIMPVSGDNFLDAQDLIDICKKNSDVVNLLVLSTYKNPLPHNKNSFLSNQLESPELRHLLGFLTQQFRSKPCAYLTKVISKKPAWVFIAPVFQESFVVGYLDSYLYRKFQERYRKKKGKYFLTVNGNQIHIRSLLPFFFRKSVQKILFNYFFSGKKKSLRSMIVLVIDGPSITSDGWDLCDGCPDSMYYNGKLVPSCLLERVKIGEKIETN